jgi:cytochrome c-type biogenesis protein CcmH/NrfG
MKRIVSVLFLLLLLNSAYLAGFATPSVFYMVNVLLHIVAGAAIVGLFAWMIRREHRLGAALLVVSGAVGAWLAYAGNTLDQRLVLYAHIALAVAAVLACGRRYQVAAVALSLIPLLAFTYQRVFPDAADRIVNPRTVPVSMEEEGNGPQSPFWPASTRTNLEQGNGKIPAKFFMESKQCGECHKDIYEQWNSSVHHFASFNNQFYRKSIEDMQEKQGSTKGSRWCAACHDHAVLFSGKWEKPIKDQIETPEAQTGLGCVSCHSITQVHNGTQGNAGFVMEYPALHDLAASENKYIRAIDNFLTYAEPEPHRRSFMKPFMRQDSSEYCATCHKVHLDVPVNNYRWLRGFNDYDNWQASGVSGQGARSFYYPDKTSTCSDCHMPKVPSKDPGSKGGMVHSHRFATANTAVAAANQDEAQMKETLAFLKSGWIGVDIFAASPAAEPPKEMPMQRRGDVPALSSTMAVGEEGEANAPAYVREVGEVSAPVNVAGTTVKPGANVRLDVVVRTKKIGHFFPGGTVDAFDIWLELQGKDAEGKVVYWSGRVEDGGKGPVEKGAHFYRSYMLDGEGNHINKRNAWQARSVLYVRLIPPGAADVAHYRVKIPASAKGPITFTAKLNYRKFAHYYTNYVYEGVKNPSGAVKGVPDVPIVTLAAAETKLMVGEPKPWSPVVRKEDRVRWNDWGIGLLLQGDLKGAQYAFKKVTEADPGYADGWLNMARALIQEGETDAAKPYVRKALAIDSSLGRIHFFQAMIQKADGDYDGALRSLNRVLGKYPRDRVALNQAGRVLFLQRKYPEAVAMFERVLGVDAEDLQAHYNLMLAYRGLGDVGKAEREEKLFRRFKADESSQQITAKPRLTSPEDNNERQAIHEHESAPIVD